MMIHMKKFANKDAEDLEDWRQTAQRGIAGLLLAVGQISSGKSSI